MITLEEFLFRAKRHGYASGKPPITLKEEPEAKIYLYSEENLKPGLEYRLDYEDRYQGDYSFFGTETVWMNNKEVWKMSYSGQMLPEYQEPDLTRQTYGFLKKALRRDRKTKPIRGPKSFRHEEFKDFEYVNALEGDIHFFRGTEIIFFRAKGVYRCYYNGCNVIPKL